MCFGYGPADARDGGTEFGIRREDTVVAMAMDARGRYEASEPLEKLNRREHDLGRTVEAAEAYRAALERTPGRAMSLEGLAAAQR